VTEFVQTGLAAWWAPALAFAAGVVSFASPCVFPLVPGYLAFVSGGSTRAPSGGSGADERPPRPVAPIVLFIAGFSSVFVGLSAFGGLLGSLLRGTAGRWITGVIIAGFGVLLLLYATRRGWAGLYAERRPLLSRVRPGRAWAFPLGMAFAAGWTPCIGPVLAGILAIAAGQGGGLRGAFLLLAYSLGLGLPFLLVGLGIDRLMGALGVVKRNYHWIAGASGVVMVTIGVLVATNQWVRLLAPVLREVNRFTPVI
jgi:cytochrome c-type biogenesis protein